MRACTSRRCSTWVDKGSRAADASSQGMATSQGLRQGEKDTGAIVAAELLAGRLGSRMLSSLPFLACALLARSGLGSLCDPGYAEALARAQAEGARGTTGAAIATITSP